MAPWNVGHREHADAWVFRLVLAAALTAALIAVLISSGGFQAIDEAFGKGDPKKAASAEYQERPGWGCGDRNHVHTGPPGRPDASPPPGCASPP
jgi:hypothetical protein